MKARKYLILAALGVMVAALALVGCSSGASSSSAASASSDASSEAAVQEITLVTPGTITVLTSPDYPPFESLDADGNYVGLDIAIAQAVAEKLGYAVEYKTLQFDGIVPAIAAGGQGDIGISGFSVDPDRAKEIDFTTSYYIDDQAIAVMDTSDITEANADEMLGAEGIVIAVQSGTTGESYILENYPNAVVQPYGNSTDAFAAMQSGQAAAVCTNLAVVQSMLENAYQDAHIVKTIATGEEYAIVVSQDNPALTEAINKALAELQADGTLDRLINEYM